MRKIRKVHADSMRPHTHTRRAAHAPASHLEPRSRSPSCAKRVYVTSPKRHTRHGSCARTARSSQRTQDTTHDTHSDEPCPDSHADADTQTRDTQAQANPVRSRPHADRHADAQSKDTQTDTQTSPPRPWRRTCRGTVRPHLLDLQLPRRRQTSCPALLALVALCCLRGNRTEGTEFMTEFMDPVRVS